MVRHKQASLAADLMMGLLCLAAMIAVALGWLYVIWEPMW